MKNSILALLFIFVSTVQIAYSQEAIDYYPLRVGNYWVQHTLWEGVTPATFRFEIEDIDIIGEKEYFRMKQGYIHDDGSKESYWYFWIREDIAGIVGGAFGNSSDISTASIYETPQLMYPNEMVNLGHTWEINNPEMGGLFSYSVESISETVTVPAGTFNDCLKIRLVLTNASGDTTQTNSYYYAFGIGEVLNIVRMTGFDKDVEFKLIEYFLSNSVTEATVNTNHYYLETLPPEYGYAEYELEFKILGDNIFAVTVEGPNVPLTIIKYEDTFGNGEWRWGKLVELPGKPAVGDTYTFHVTYDDLTTEVFTDSITGVIDEFPIIISPVHGSTITTIIPKFEWSALNMELGSLSIHVWETESEKLIWMPEVSKEVTSIVYNFDGTGEPLQADMSYSWILIYRHKTENSRATIFSEFTIDEKVGVGEENNTLNPLVFHLSPNYPNPFNPTTTIEYSIPLDGHVILAIYNISGQRITVLSDKYQQAGKHSVTWNAAGMSSGLYFCTLYANGMSETRKIVLVK